MSDHNGEPGPAFRRLAPLLAPRSVAVIGASDQAGSLGGRAVTLLRKFGYPGAVYPVNPRRDSVDGLKCVPNVAALPAPVDLAIVAVAAGTTLAALRDCHAAGIQAAVVWAGGFAEADDAGVALQRELTAFCRDTGFLLCGPNCLGIIDARLPLTATFASSLVTTDCLVPGDISVVSQSGGTAMAVQALAQQAGFGFRLMISCGNEAALGLPDYIEALVDDPHTAVIAMYVEGVRDGPRFLAALGRARAAGKPIVALKAGRTAAAGRAAAAHTGALAGDDRVWEAVREEFAVIPAQSVRQLTDVALALSSYGHERLPRGNGVAIASFGGGIGVLATDLCAQNGLATPPLAESTRERLRPLLPPIAATANPIDMTPGTFAQPWIQQFPAALDAMMADPAIDALFLPMSAMATGAPDVAKALAELLARTHKSLCVSWMFAPPAAELLTAARLHVFPEPAAALQTLGLVAQYGMRVAADAARAGMPSAGVGGKALLSPAASVQSARGEGGAVAFDWRAHLPAPREGQVVTEDACHRILAAAGLPVARAHLARSADDAVAAGADVGLPVALKGISEAVTHRAAAGLLALDLRTADEVRDGYHRLAQRAEQTGVTLDGVYVQHMAAGRLELLVSAFRDPVFGVMVTVGAGGNLAEVIDDVALARAPLDREAAAVLLCRLRIVQRAARVDPEAALPPLVDFVTRFAAIAATAPWPRFVLEVNPVKWSREGVVAVDGLLIVEAP